MELSEIEVWGKQTLKKKKLICNSCYLPVLSEGED